MIIKKSRKKLRQKRHKKIRNKISGTETCPRLSVFKSNRYLSAQIINDEKGETIVSATTKTMDLKNTSNIEAASKLGEEIAKLALDKKIDNIVFDRSGYIYHGRIKAIAEAARNKGLKF